MSNRFLTVPQILLHTVAAKPRRDCLVWKENGAWRELATDEVVRAVLEIAAGLRRSGINPGDRIGILAPSSVHWLLFDLGALCCGAITVPLFDNLSEENFRFEIGDAEPRMILVADATQRELVSRVCGPEVVVVTLESAGGEGVVTLDSLRADHSEEDLDDSRKRALEVGESDLATLIYTSGSTGSPKGVEITHGALAFQVRGVFQRYPLDPDVDVSLTCLPLAHVFERMVVLYHLAAGVRLVFAESVQTVGESMREQHPTVVTVVPRLLEKILERIEIGAREGSLFKRLLVGLALAEGARPRTLWRMPLRIVLDVMVYRKIRALMGGRLRLVVSGGAALGSATESLFRSFRIPVYQGYGLTEHSPVVSANFPGSVQPGSVGRPFPDVETRIAEDGEVLVRSPAVLRGYWKRPNETELVRDAEGWLHTGDLGHLDANGFLFLTGRKKDLCKTAGGKYVAPGPIEEMLSSHKGIEHAVISVDGRKFVSALLTPDLVAIRRRMAEISYAGTETEYVQKELAVSVERHLVRVNARLDAWAKIRKWAFVDPLTVANGGLTPTLKVRRSAILARHASILERFYLSGEAH